MYWMLCVWKRLSAVHCSWWDLAGTYLVVQTTTTSVCYQHYSHIKSKSTALHQLLWRNLTPACPKPGHKYIPTMEHEFSEHGQRWVTQTDKNILVKLQVHSKLSWGRNQSLSSDGKIQAAAELLCCKAEFHECPSVCNMSMLGRIMKENLHLLMSTMRLSILQY